MENSAFGKVDGDGTIIDTDGTNSDASMAMMDPKIAASLFLSPTLLTKRLHQAIRSIERHNWEQLTYLLSANPWLAEMADVTTGQYLLHKLALYGAGIAVTHPDTGDVVRVEAPAAPVELSRNLIRMFPASVHKFDQDGNLPLHMAAISGNQEMCRFLGERFPSGASVRNEEGLLPLHMAIQSCSTPAPSADGTIICPSEIVRTILEFFPGAVAVADNDGNLPLHCAASALHGELGVDIIFMLLDEADKQVKNGLMFRIAALKSFDDDAETVTTDATATPTEVSAADDCSYCNLVRNNMGHTPLVAAVRSRAGWEIIEAIACGLGGDKAVLLTDANLSNVLHLLVSGEFADAASILSVLKIAPQAAAVQNSEGMLPIEVSNHG
jgi:ankyrin repeat protein